MVNNSLKPFVGDDHMLDRLSLIMRKYELRHEISNNVVCATSKASDQPVHTRNLIRAFASNLNILRVLSY